MLLRSVLLSGFKANIFQVTKKDTSLSVLVKSLASVKLSENQPIKYCNIKKLEVNQELSEMKQDEKDHLDKCVAYILRRTSMCQN